MKLTIPDNLPISGHVEIPDTITGRMFCAWWEAYENVKGEPPRSYPNSDWMKRWRGAVALVSGWGKFHINEVNVGDITPDGDNVPLELIAWLGLEIDAHIGGVVSLKKTV